MSLATIQTIAVLQLIVQTVPLGTNIALLQLMWTIVNGSFLQSRGVIFPALVANGHSPRESRRIWQAFRHGVWRIDDCLSHFRDYVAQEGKWIVHIDRWPVEQIPLVAKQVLGLHHQFVFAAESCNRLPELAFLLANVLTYLAAVLPPCPLASGTDAQKNSRTPPSCFGQGSFST